MTSNVVDHASLALLAMSAGIPESQADTAAAIAQAESGGKIDALNPSGAAGLWQILPSAHPEYDANKLRTDPAYNAKAMAAISDKGTNWNPWTTYTSGAYKQYLSKSPSVGQQLNPLTGVSVPNPISSATSSVAKIFDTFFQASVWKRIGVGYLGMVLAIIGIIIVVTNTKAGKGAIDAGAGLAMKGLV
jgi:hypothetical protein